MGTETKQTPHLYAMGEVETLPCGCEVVFEKRKQGAGLVCLVVRADPSCPQDGVKIGLNRGFVRYEALAKTESG